MTIDNLPFFHFPRLSSYVHLRMGSESGVVHLRRPKSMFQRKSPKINLKICKWDKCIVKPWPQTLSPKPFSPKPKTKGP